ncbi:protein downstream neighbor of son homolog [Paramacrobiotus metropolitanus]|uniref:protein downstream neighbor of son homolog n=1 Tax=Paramacrobiotus metropolitanus TaxID=2943436 RepID=UPI002445C60F|nr:protein downstream neighbor of son homolog [Paramacrobiotus metropolitanus]
MSGRKLATPSKEKKTVAPSPRKSNSWSAGAVASSRSSLELPRSTSSGLRPQVSLSKFRAKRCEEKLSFKRHLLDDESDSGFDSPNSQSSSAYKKPLLANPFYRDDSTSDSTQFTQLEGPSTVPYSIVIEASSLVDRLKRQDARTAYLASGLQEPGHARNIVQSASVNQPVAYKEAFVPYKDYYDWSLKTKLRITISNDLKWLSALTPQDRTKRIKPTKGEGQAAGSRFMRLLQYYIFPFLNGVKTFPRQAVFSMEASIDWQKVMPDLQKEWSTSLLELLDNLTSGECPFFYVVSHQWIALFLSRKLSGADRCCGYITPTTSGFRDTMDIHGIAFRMPLRPPTDGQCADKSIDELDTSSESEKHGQGGMNIQWIKETCLSVGKIIDTTNKNSLENLIDSRPESIVALDGAEVESFVTALAKEKSLQPSGGLLVNVPPTLIAPVTFANATSRKLEFSYGRSNGVSFLEIPDGPIMPHFIPALAELLRDKNADLPSASAVYSSLESSLTLARITVPEEKHDFEIQPNITQVKLEDALPAQKTTRQKSVSAATFEQRYASVIGSMCAYQYI